MAESLTTSLTIERIERLLTSIDASLKTLVATAEPVVRNAVRCTACHNVYCTCVQPVRRRVSGTELHRGPSSFRGGVGGWHN